MQKQMLLAVIVVSALMLIIICPLAEKKETTSALRPLATLHDLIEYPDEVPANGKNADQILYVSSLPSSDLVVVLRPITESEYGSFQVQAIGYEIIERQMLAAAIVFPKVTETDLVGFESGLVTFLQLQVNKISGFEVFPAGELSD